MANIKEPKSYLKELAEFPLAERAFAKEMAFALRPFVAREKPWELQRRLNFRTVTRSSLFRNFNIARLN